MKKFLVLMGYLAGFVIGAKYTKKPGKVTKGSKSIGDKALALGQEFVDSHKKAFDELKKEYWTEENKKLVLSKKKDLEKFFALAKEELAEAGTILKKHGIDAEAISDHIESIYEEKKHFIEKLGKTPAAKKAKKKLGDLVRKVKKSI